METKLLYLKGNSRRENIKFMNIAVDSTEARGRRRNLEVLAGTWPGPPRCKNRRDTTVEKEKTVILVPFSPLLKYKDVQKIFSLGHRLKEKHYQMFRDYPPEVDKRRKDIENL